MVMLKANLKNVPLKQYIMQNMQLYVSNLCYYYYIDNLVLPLRKFIFIFK